MREFCITTIGCIGAFIVASLGGWDLALQTLMVFAIIDYITGLLVAGVFKKSIKSESGALNSRAGFKALIKKGAMLLIVVVAYQLDILLDVGFVRYAAIISFIINELISIVENCGLMGLPIPTVFKNAIDILNRKKDNE